MHPRALGGRPQQGPPARTGNPARPDPGKMQVRKCVICGGEHWTDSCPQKAQFLNDANVGLNVRTGGRAQGAPGSGKPSSLAKTGAPFPRPAQPGAQVSFVRDEAPGSRPHAGCSTLCPFTQDLVILDPEETKVSAALSMHSSAVTRGVLAGYGATPGVLPVFGATPGVLPVSGATPGVLPVSGATHGVLTSSGATFEAQAHASSAPTRLWKPHTPLSWALKTDVKVAEPDRELATGSALAAAMLVQGQRLIAMAGALTEGRSKEGKKIYPESFQPAMLEQLSSLGKLLAQEVTSRVWLTSGWVSMFMSRMVPMCFTPLPGQRS